MAGKIAYQYGEGLYLNITNKCPNRCAFCVKWPDFTLHGVDLRLEQEPTVDEIIEACGDVTGYPEVVFCGFGEPTERLETLIETARRLREAGAKRIRLNTSGQADLIAGKPTVPMLAQMLDAVNVSLNAQEGIVYRNLCRSRYGYEAYAAVKRFIVDCREAGLDVTASVVRHPDVDVDACRHIAEDELGVKFRARG